MARRPPRSTPIPTALYRMFDADGCLLYVGISSNIIRRFANHRQWRDWWNDVHTITVENFPTSTEAAEHEKVAILTEYPRHNVTFNDERARAMARREGI
jgi:predicted GIY-YIG superfamily endonuclease